MVTHRPFGGWAIPPGNQSESSCTGCRVSWVVRVGPGTPPWVVEHGRYSIGIHSDDPDHEIWRLLDWAAALPDVVT